MSDADMTRPREERRHFISDRDCYHGLKYEKKDTLPRLEINGNDAYVINSFSSNSL